MRHRETSLPPRGEGSVGELCEAVLSVSADLIFIFDRAGRYLYANPAGAHALSEQPSDIIGQNWRDLAFPAVNKELFGREQETIFRTGQSVRLRTSFANALGLRDYECIMKPLRGPQGEVTAAVCVARDVAGQGSRSQKDLLEQLGVVADPELHIEIDTEARSEDATKRGGEPLVLAPDALPALISYVDADERYRFNNPDYAQWFGYKPEEINGKSVRELLGDPAYKLIQPFVETALLGKPVSFEQVIPHRKDGARTVRANYMPDRARDGTVRGFFAVVSDLGEPVQVVAKEQVGQDLTQLAHVSRLSALGKMASEIIHEISQPLSAIAAYSEACLRVINSHPVDTDKLLPWIRDVNAQARRAGSLVRRLRSFARKGEPHREIVDLNEVVRNVVEITRLDRDTKSLNLDIRFADTSCLVLGDELLLEQVVLNILRNAVEAVTRTDGPSGRITISTDVDAERVQVTFSDTGPGIPEENRSKVFEPFFTSRSEGVGVGLAISLSIIEAHGGQLTVTDNMGGGACFQFTVPRYRT